MKTLFALLSALLLPTFAAFGVVSITVHPAANTIATDGGTVTLQVTAVSSNSLEYQWFKGTTTLTGKTSNKLVLSSVKDADSGTYKVVVTEIAPSPDTAESDAAVVVVNTRPKITIKPVAPAPIPTEASTVSFDVTASGTEPFTFTWQKKVGTTYVPHVALNAAVTAPTTSSSRLTLTDVQLVRDTGIYRVSVTNVTGVTVNSTDVVLKINSRPVILTPPVPALNIATGGTGTLKVVAGGNAPFSYAWFKNNVEIAKTNSPTLSIKGTAPTTVPDLYRVEISNAYSPRTPDLVKTVSSNAAVHIINKPKILTQPQKPLAPLNITGAPVNHTLSVGMDTSGNPGNFTYQWQKDGKNIANADQATLNFSPISWSDRGSYKVIVKNEVGSITSAAVTLTIISPPVIISQPSTNIFAATKGSVKLSVVAGGTTPLIYEWFHRPVGGSFGTIPIGKAATLALSGLKATQTGDYKCKVTNQSKPVSTGSIESSLIFLQVDDAPVIKMQTAVDGVDTTGTKVRVGNKIHLTIKAEGTNTVANPLTYQWQHNNVNIIGQTTDELLINPADFINTGVYKCVVQNFSGKVISNPLTITVQRPPVIVNEPADAAGYEESRVETTAMTVTGDPTFTYKWEKRAIGLGGAIIWNPVSGQTTTKLIFASAQTGQSGTYRCIVKNSVDEAISREVLVNVDPIPAPTLGAVPGLSAVEFFPQVARSTDKVRLFGRNLKYTKSVKFGTVAATYVIESDNSLLITVPPAAPTTPTSIVVASKNGSTPTTDSFTRTTDFHNFFDDATILPGTVGSFTYKLASNAFAETIDPFGRVYYLLNVPKQAYVTVTCNGGVVDFTYMDPSLEVYRERLSPGSGTSFLGPDGVTVFPTNSQSKSTIVGNIAEGVIFLTDGDDQDVLIMVRSSAPPGVGLVGFGPYELSVSVSAIPSSSLGVSTSTSSPLGDENAESSTWHSSDDSDSGGTTLSINEEGIETFRLGGDETVSGEPILIWKDQNINLAGASKIRCSFNMSLEEGRLGGDDQFSWQINGKSGNTLGALWINSSDGEIQLIEPNGKSHPSIQHITPGGGAQRIELIIDPKMGTWIVQIDGVDVTEPIPLPAGEGFSDVYGVWDLGLDGVASGASILFDSFRVEAEVAP